MFQGWGNPAGLENFAYYGLIINVAGTGGLVSQVNPLQTGRFYRVKNPRKKFLCALCSAPREMKYSKNLTGKNYLQIIILSVFLSWACFPLMGAKALTLLFPVWMAIELANKLLYRKDIPCPYCGFDATWYRRDVNIANSKVKTFWNENYPELVKTKTDENVAKTVNNPVSVEPSTVHDEAYSQADAI